MRWVRIGRTILLLIVLLGAAVAWAAEPVFPALTGRVVDDADVLAPDAKARLAGDLAAHEQATGDQVVVATVRSLQNLSIEEFANRLFRHWQLGDIYSPSELSPAHMAKSRTSRTLRNVDIVDELGLRPIDMYKVSACPLPFLSFLFFLFERS